METNPTPTIYNSKMLNNIEFLSYDILINEKICGVVTTNKIYQQMAGRHNASNQPDRTPKLINIECSGCNYNIANFSRKFYDEEQDDYIAELANHGVIIDPKNKIMCDKCNYEMKRVKRRPGRYICYKQLNPIDNVVGKCKRKRKKRNFVGKIKKRKNYQCLNTVSILNETYFTNLKIKGKFFNFIFYYCNELFTQQYTAACLNTCRKTVNRWYKILDHVCIKYLDKYKPMIGGPKVIVELDETVVTAKKDPDTNKNIYFWLFGGTERYGDVYRRFLTPLFQIHMYGKFEDSDKESVMKIPKSAEVLNKLVQKYVRPNSVIFTDKWPGYNHLKKLEEEKYTHKTVSHRNGFINKKKPFVHTNTIESFWTYFKNKNISPGRRLKNMERYIARFLVLHKDQPRIRKNKNRDKIERRWQERKFHNFLKILAEISPKLKKIDDISQDPSKHFSKNKK